MRRELATDLNDQVEHLAELGLLFHCRFHRALGDLLPVNFFVHWVP